MGSKRREDGGERKEKRSKEERRERKALKRAKADGLGVDATASALAPEEQSGGGAAAAAAAGGEQEQEPQAVAGSHAADASAVEALQQSASVRGGANKAAAPVAAAAPAGGKAGSDGRKPGKPAPVLPWMRVPIAIEASEGTLLEEVQGLDPRLRRALEGTGIEVLFPVQTVVWAETAGGASAAHDVCIAAPTGSGKTLSYALPVLQALAGRAAPALRALVVLPTRDLAAQVFEVLGQLASALGLTTALAAGKASLAAEAQLLAGGGIDILVATPGRLIAHLEGTPGFTLASLRFLVVDETDRLLRQAYQDWLPKVVAALHAPDAAAAALDGAHGGGGGGAGAAAPRGLPGQQLGARQRRVVKFVVSATLTRDPSKTDRLALHCPRYIAMSAVDHRYQLPRSLKEAKLVVPAERKPAALAALLQELRGESTIVFTSSVEATHRLYLLLAALSCLPDRVVEFSSLVPPPERAAHLEAFRSGAAKVLVCSDAMTRGMDVAGVQNVINYDAPVYVKTYVHRAGRTARAGRSGRVTTLLRHEDVRHFKAMLRKADNAFVSDHRLAKGALEDVREAVDDALDAMGAALAAEAAAVAAAREAGEAAGRAVAAAAGAAAAGGTEQANEEVGTQWLQRDGAQWRHEHKRRRVAGVPEFSLLPA